DDSDEDEEADKDEVHTTTNAETEDASVPKSSFPRPGWHSTAEGEKNTNQATNS
nr:hypothetical protein [Tanacetum cinerariifolium]GFA99144.1 hypothetical protein [Tanacetum cinerariifolium]